MLFAHLSIPPLTSVATGSQSSKLPQVAYVALRQRPSSDP